MANHRLTLCVLALGAVLWVPEARAQDEPDEPKDDVDVERPEEIKRIKMGLKQVEDARFRLTNSKSTIREQPMPSGKNTSPVLVRREEVWGLSLREAIEEALENNPDYLLALLDARSAQEVPDQERAVFDPIVGFTGTWTDARSAFFSNNPFTGLPAGLSVASSENLSLSTSVNQLLPTGTLLTFTWDESRLKTENVFSLNPQYTPRLTLSVSQPLLRGFGLDVNLARLRNARNDSLSADAALADTYMIAVLAVEQAYWNLIAAEEELRSQQTSLNSAIQLLVDQREREKHGAATKLEVTIAKAGVASRRELVIVAESSLEAARDQIIRLCRPSSDSTKWDLLVVPIDLPTMIPEPELDPGRSIPLALERRPDYYQAKLALENAQRNVVAAENGVLPSVNVIASWSQEGLGGQHHSAWSGLGNGRFYTWSAGLSVELPLFLRSERAALRQARHLLERAEVSMRAVEANAVLEVRRAIRDIRTAKARIEASRASRILAEERLAATREMLNVGTAVPRDVLEDLALLSAARRSEVQAFINYRLSITSLKRAQGTLLDDLLDQLPPRVRRALDRKAFRN